MGVGVLGIHWNVTPHRSSLGVVWLISLLLRALAHIGNVHLKMERYQLAIKYFDNSVAEHRNQDIVKKKLEVRHFVRVFFFLLSLFSIGREEAEGDEQIGLI